MSYLERFVAYATRALVEFRRYNTEVLFSGVYLWCAISCLLPDDVLGGTIKDILRFGDPTHGTVAFIVYFSIFIVKMWSLVENNKRVRKLFLSFSSGFMTLLTIRITAESGFVFVSGIFALLAFTAMLTLWRFSANEFRFD